jgi:cytochrome o ubiquinol oxidase subunit 3
MSIAIEAGKQETKTLGFWIYLMTDCVLFATLFATYAVLHGNTFGGPTGGKLFDLPNVLIETLLLLTSSFTVGLAVLSASRGYKKLAIALLVTTFALGVGFLSFELSEFNQLIASGNSWTRSGFLSGFFTLVATHGLHITIGLLWMIVMMYRLLRFNFKTTDINRLALMGLFWHFLDIIWIFIFTFVYMIGSIS